MMPSVRNRLIVFLAIGIAAIVAVGVWFVQVPAQLGIGRYVVRLDLADGGGLYPTANVTYRGVTIGRVTEVRMTDDGAEANPVARLVGARPGVDRRRDPQHVGDR